MGAYFRLYDHKHTPISSLLCTARISEPSSFTPDMNTSQDNATTEQTSQIETQLAPAPFDDQAADIILISSDNVHFYVHKLLLSLVSPVFQTMFGLPSHDKQETQDGRPCLAVAEDRHHLVQLLSWCDPRCSPTLTRLEDFQIVWELADKYSMDDIMTKVKNTLASVNKGISANPLTAFAVSTRFGCKELAIRSAREVLEIPFRKWEIIPEMKHLSAFALQHLIQYRHKCEDAASSVATDMDWVNRSLYPGLFFATQCQESCKVESRKGKQWNKWWLDYVDLAATSLRETPCGRAVEERTLLEHIHTEISSGPCTKCRKKGIAHFNSFSRILAVEVEKRIDKVKMAIEFIEPPVLISISPGGV